MLKDYTEQISVESNRNKRGGAKCGWRHRWVSHSKSLWAKWSFALWQKQQDISKSPSHYHCHFGSKPAPVSLTWLLLLFPPHCSFLLEPLKVYSQQQSAWLIATQVWSCYLSAHSQFQHPVFPRIASKVHLLAWRPSMIMFTATSLTTPSNPVFSHIPSLYSCEAP